jgi:hypothetical protein
MKIYYIALGIMILSAATQISNDMGIFNKQLPNTSMSLTEGQVTDLTTVPTTQSLTPDIFGVGMMVKAFTTLTSVLTAAITIIPMSIQYGIPYQIYLPIQGIVWFVYSMGLFQLITGRGTKLYD